MSLLGWLLKHEDFLHNQVPKHTVPAAHSVPNLQILHYMWHPQRLVPITQVVSVPKNCITACSSAQHLKLTMDNTTHHSELPLAHLSGGLEAEGLWGYTAW